MQLLVLPVFVLVARLKEVESQPESLPGSSSDLEENLRIQNEFLIKLINLWRCAFFSALNGETEEPEGGGEPICLPQMSVDKRNELNQEILRQNIPQVNS